MAAVLLLSCDFIFRKQSVASAKYGDNELHRGYSVYQFREILYLKTSYGRIFVKFGQMIQVETWNNRNGVLDLNFFCCHKPIQNCSEVRRYFSGIGMFHVYGMYMHKLQ